MRIVIAGVSGRRGNTETGPAGELIALYTKRASRYMECEHRTLASEARLLESLHEPRGGKRRVFYAADSRGDQITSEQFAALIRELQDTGTQVLVIGIGPHDGWSESALGHAAKKLALGRVTLPHELAAVIFAEQVYRALTILAGHPYHSGH